MIAKLMTDSAMIGYFLLLVLCVYGFGLFLWGFIKAEKQGWQVSAVYVYVMGMLGAIAYNQCLCLVARYYTLLDNSIAFRSTILWGLRSWPLILAVGGIVVHMSYKAFAKKFK